MLWKIWYADGSAFSNEEGPPEAAPAFGVQAIACVPDLWGCGDVVGLIQYLADGWGVVRFGSLTTNDNYLKALRAAQDDMGFDQGTRHIYTRGDYYWYNGGRS